MKKAGLLSLVLIMIFSSKALYAFEPIFYAGTALGRSDLDFSGFDDSDMAWNLFGGWQINPYFSVEAGWTDLGELRETLGTLSAEFEVDGLQVSALATAPFGNGGGVYARLGTYTWEADAKACSFANCIEDQDDKTDIAWGLGASYDFNKQFGIRGEFERFDIDGEDIDMLSAAAYIRF